MIQNLFHIQIFEWVKLDTMIHRILYYNSYAHFHGRITWILIELNLMGYCSHISHVSHLFPYYKCENRAYEKHLGQLGVENGQKTKQNK